MDVVLRALADQQAELDGLISGLDEGGWAQPSRCAGWSIADVVLHLAQTDELATASALGTPSALSALGPTAAAAGRELTVDEAIEQMVGSQRGQPGTAVRERWLAAVAAQREALATCEPGRRLRWLDGELAARTLATTRLSETWIHSGDVAWGLGVTLTATDRLWHIARLAWRTVPYAFGRAATSLDGTVALTLIAPDGSTWDFGDRATAATTIEGPAEQFCLIAARRLDPADSTMRATGRHAAEVLRLVRTYAQ
jgi:uncharacterized protein (TIGR03084 family)